METWQAAALFFGLGAAAGIGFCAFALSCPYRFGPAHQGETVAPGKKIIPPQGGSGTAPPQKKPNEFAGINSLLNRLKYASPPPRTHPCA